MPRRAEDVRTAPDGLKATSELEIDDARVLMALTGPSGRDRERGA